MGVHPRFLLGLFGAPPASLTSSAPPSVPVAPRAPPPHAPLKLQLLSQIIHSRITPDTLDGIWRTGCAYGVPVPAPQDLVGFLGRNLFEVTVAARGFDVVADFWRKKGHIYATYINAPDAMRRDSTWSLAIEGAFRGISLEESLELSEEEVLRSVRQFELPGLSAVDRYKPPLAYTFCADAARRWAPWTPVAALAKALLKTRADGSPDGSPTDRSPQADRSRALV